MARLNRFQLMERHKEDIINSFASMEKRVYSLSEINKILDTNREEWSLPKKTTVFEFLDFLLERNVLKEVKINLPLGKTSRYIFQNPSAYEIALSIKKGSYLSHYSALFIHGLTNNVVKNIYTNVEQPKKWSNEDDENVLEQKNIDLAFSRPMRMTKQIAKFELNGEKYQVYLLNGKNHNRLGVKTFVLQDKELPVTDIERTLIDITVRPNYAGGVEEVMEAFILAKGRFSVNKMLATLKKMNYRYPYHQLLGFYLEHAGYSEKVLKLFDQFEIKYDFYLTYQMRDKEFSKRWRVYYPKGFLTRFL